MGYFTTWQTKIEDTSDPIAYNDFVEEYYKLEQTAYDKILQEGSEIIEGQADKLAEKLGFNNDMVIFLGFLDGLQESLLEPQQLELVENNTMLKLHIDFSRLYTNMLKAKADWLYGLDSWINILSIEKQNELSKQYKESQIVRVEKIGRNEPCPCGSGKKYKKCCALK